MKNKIYLILQNKDGSTGSMMGDFKDPADAILEGMNLIKDNAAGVDPVKFDQAFVVRTDGGLQLGDVGRVALKKTPNAFWSKYGWVTMAQDWYAWMEAAVENKEYDLREMRGELQHDLGSVQ